MTAGLETFAKVRVLHDRTDNPGEKAAAASRMEALARSAGMTVAEAVSKLDEATAQPDMGVDWTAFADAFRRAEAAGAAADAPEAPSRRRGLPIYDPGKVECWRDVAWHCLQLDRTIPKAHGGKFLTKDERARIKAVAQRGPVTNATADWIETVLARCEAARVAWRDRSGLFQDGARPGRKVGESDVEWTARMVAAAKEREASKLDRPQPRPEAPARAAADDLSAFFNRPEFVAERQEREARRQVEAAAIVERYGSLDAVYADTPLEAALRAACAPLLGPGETWRTVYRLDGWGSLSPDRDMPASVRVAVSEAWPLPATVAEAWAEHEAAEMRIRERYTVDAYCDPEVFSQARAVIVRGLLDTLPARSLNDVRARVSWLEFWPGIEVEQNRPSLQTTLATLRADIERIGQRIREQDGAAVQNGHPETPPPNAAHFPPDPGKTVSPVQSGHPHRTNADKRRDVLALLDQGLTDREIARRAGVSPTTVGTIRRARP